MTKPNHGSSLLQARDSDSHALLESTSPNSDGPHSFHRRHLKAAYHNHHKHLHSQKRHQTHGATNDKDIQNDPATNSKVPSDLQSLDTRELDTVDANIQARSLKPAVTHVVQTVSVIQVVDHTGKPLQTETKLAPPNTVVVDGSGITISVSHPDPTQSDGQSSLGTGPSLSTSTHTTITTSSTSLSSAHTSGPGSPAYPTLSVGRNGTHPSGVHGNVTIASIAGTNSTVRPMAKTAVSSMSSGSKSLTSFRGSSHTSSSTPTDITSSFTTSSDDIAFSTIATGAAAPTQSSDSGSGTPDLTPQQQQIVGGVVGGVAGAAIFALVIMLLLRYKRKRDAQALINADQSSASGSRALPGTDGSGGGSDMSERNAGSAAVLGALASLTGKRSQQASAGAAAPPPPTGERGFYRVSGRKLPSVLTSGGDGYTDPRESTMSDQSNYSDGSQSSEPIARSTPYALGTPMRPISGIPIMRSGPARTPVQQNNPFADPSPSPFADPPKTPPSPPRSSPARSLGQRESPRMSGSRFQEGI